MKQVRKRIGSLLLSLCMVFTMLPTVALAQDGVQDSVAPSSASEIIVFADLAEDVALQEVVTGTSVDELNLPNTLTATVITGAATTVAGSVYSTETDSEVQESNITVSDWASNPEYNPDYDPEGTNSYVFTPTLDLPEGVTLADGVEPPTITVTVNAPAALKFLPRGIPDTDSLKNAIEAAGLTATVDVERATVTVTGEATGGMILLNIGEGVTVVWNATYTSNGFIALKINGTGTFRIIGGKLTSTTKSGTMVVSSGSPLVVIDGGDNALHSGYLFIQWNASSGRLVYLSGIINDNQINKISKSVIAYYADENISKFTSKWTEGIDLLPLKDVVLTREDGSAYSYEIGTAFVGTVTAMLPDVFDLSGATVTSSVYTTDDYTVNINENNISYSGTLNAEDLTITVSGATVGGVSIGDFTTPAFGVNITPITPVTDITDVPKTTVVCESLALSGKVEPANATKQDISWSIKDTGSTGASITGSTLFATAPGMVTVTATITGGVASGTDYTQDFTINITPFIPVTGIIDVPDTLVVGESLALSGTVEPANATKQDISWSIKDSGDTNASITGSTLSATAAGTVTVTATIPGGVASGTDYTQDFAISVKEVLTVDPTFYIFDPLEEGYGDFSYLDKAEPKTFTITNIGNTPLTGLHVSIPANVGDWYTITGGIPDSLESKKSAQITVTPKTGLMSGTYETTLYIKTASETLALVPISLTVTEMAPRLRLGETDVHKLDADFSGTGYSWNAGTKTLTLTSDYAAGQIEFMYCNAETMTLKLAGDVTIDEHEISQAECIYSSGNLTIDLGGHTLTLITGNNNNSALDGDTLIIQNGILVARLLGSGTGNDTPSIDTCFLTVGNATVTADADSLDYGGIDIINSLTLKQGAKLRTCGAVGLDFLSAYLLNLESDDISLTAIGGTYAIDLDADLKYPEVSELRSWTNTDVTPPSPAGAGALLFSMNQEEWQMLWSNSKYVHIGIETPETVVTGISVKSNPNKLTYTEGDKLDLSGLSATLTYSDATTKEVPYTAFAANSISMTYADGGAVAQGDTLSTAQNGKAIVLMVGSYTAQTNALTVKSIPKYNVTVTNGTGSGEYAKGTTVTITANTPDSGKQFKEWTVVSGGATLANAQAASTTFTMPANAVEVTATYVDLPANAYLITVQNDGNGTANANVNSAAQGKEITLTAIPKNGYRFKEWQVVSGGVTINNNKFIMPAEKVIVKGIFEAVTIKTYAVTFNLNGGTRTGGGELTQTVVSGGFATAPTVTRSGYTFNGWDKAFTNVTSDLTVAAIWRYKDSGSSSGDYSSGSPSGGSSSSGSSTKITTTTEKRPNQPITAAASVTAIAGTNGTARASIPDTVITDVISKAQAEAKKQGKTANGVSIELNVTMPKGATTLTATLSRNALNSLVSSGVANLTINGSPLTVTFDQKALKEIQKQSSGNLNISIAPKANLSETAKRMIGSRPVYNITMGYGNNSTVSSFGGGVAAVAIPYTPANGEAIGGLYAVYVDENGNATRVAGSAYDANSGCIIFTTNHFSMYGIGYTAPCAKFTDISSHWAKESIDYVVGRGLLSGTSETTFEPNTVMTRGMLVTVLGRLAGVDVSSYTASSFTDVKAGSTFQPYIEWAYKKGIIQGIDSNKFAPDMVIVREEIAVIIANFAKATGYMLPVTHEATTYADASSISNTCKTAVTAMQQAGIMMGGASNKFNPKSNATRAEVSSMLHRYIKLTINPDTAYGWTFNDAGQWLYYKEGKALTGTQIIGGSKYFFYSNGALQIGWVKDGNDWRYYSGSKALVGWHDIGANGKWYYFYADGSLARSTKIDNYEVDENGVRKTK